MRKQLLFASLAFVALSLSAMPEQLAGFTYALNPADPDGTEWQSPQWLSLNKEQPRATFFNFQSVDAARAVLPENSSYWKSLNGTWKFRWVGNPWERDSTFQTPGRDLSLWDDIEVPSSWNIAGIQSDGTLRYGKPIYVNQPVIFYHKVAVDDWRKGIMRTPPETWTTYKDRNEVGQYSRTFTIPADWDGREVYISFDGVDSFFYLWINGHYVGFSKNSRNAARFNITRFLQKGENTVSVEVYRSSDGSFLESADMFRLPGIFRIVALYSVPKVHISDLSVIPDLTDNYKDGVLNITASVKNLGKKNIKGYTIEYSLYSCDLYKDSNAPVQGLKPVLSAPIVLKRDSITQSVTTFDVKAPRLWSAEAPYRYVLVAQLKDNKGRVVETVSTYTGFRKVEIRDTPASEDSFGLAGRYFYVNNQPVKLRGVNRHETMPDRGHAITRENLEKQVMLMKRANINHVRNSHYPNDPYWYYLADKYGIYLEDEANIESHEYYYGAASLSHPKEWEIAHIARNMEMVHSTVNHPSIVIWSLGNEAGPGDNMKAAYKAIKTFDTSRPVQYERNNNIVDMGSNQYPSIGLTQAIASGKLDVVYPFHISEYAHSMGNAMGNLIDIWNAVESSNFICGGAIWDWVDQSLYYYDTKTGRRYLAYGGDFGDFPNDGQFVMNGIMFGDLEPKPAYYEVKKVYQPVVIKPVDMSKGQIEIFNRNYFEPFSNYTFGWILTEDGKTIASGNSLQGPEEPLKPREKAIYTIPYDLTGHNGELAVIVELRQAGNTPWAEAGYVQMSEQLPVRDAAARPSVSSIAGGGALKVSGLDPKTNTIRNIIDPITIEGDRFKAVFNNLTGTLGSLEYDGVSIIEPDGGPSIDAFRAFVNNDNWVFTNWYSNGLHNLKHTVLSGNAYLDNKTGAVVIAFRVRSQAPNAAELTGDTWHGVNSVKELVDKPFGENDFHFITDQVWTVYPDGSIELQAEIAGSNPALVLPRLGYIMNVPESLSEFTYNGRGPIENYVDRKTSQNIGIYTSTVAEQFVNYPRPQSMANHEEVRWAALTNNEGIGFVAVGLEPMSVAALPYDEKDFVAAPHGKDLPAPGYTRLHLNLGQTGLGGTSCGQAPPVESDRVKAGTHHFGFVLRPVIPSKDLFEQALVSLDGVSPIRIERNENGDVTISCHGTDDPIMYAIDYGKPQTYKSPVDFKSGGTIKAWLKSNPEIATEVKFNKINKVQTVISFVNSEEPGEEAVKVLDGDPSTIWHTMYSVTVAQYPHWIDLDTREIRPITGVTYLPRQDGNNGDFKDYEVYVSVDGKEWGDPVAKGTFSKDKSRKRVIFGKPVEGRYVRLRALNSQNGQDYGAAAEIEVLAD